MRVSKEKAADNRQKILASAARLFRERGIGATGVDSITGDAGLTHGGLYSQFGSKAAITAAAIGFATRRSKHIWQRTAERKPGSKTFPAIVDSYLSRAHRDAPGRGCVLAALGADIARQPAAVRRAFSKELRYTFEMLAELMAHDAQPRRPDDAIAAFACMTGALILARAVDDQIFSDRILKAAARRVVQLAGVRGVQLRRRAKRR
jgi:TetR/AcrR family transcriptional regulator, transcriptional repressor for nem operon